MSRWIVVTQIFFLTSHVDIVFSTPPPPDVPKLLCRDDRGRPVEWFLLHRLPAGTKDWDNYEMKGDNYTYFAGHVIDEYGIGDWASSSATGRSGKQAWFECPPNDPIKWSSKLVPEWIVSDLSLLDKSSMLTRTLAPLYAYPNSYAVAMYNDQHQRTGNGGRGVAKGVLAMGLDTGIFVTHSMPWFPEPIDKSYDFNQALQWYRGYGDSYLCMSFRTKEMGRVLARKVALLKPNVFDFSLKEDVTAIVPEFPSIKTGNLIFPGTVNKEPIILVGGTVFDSLARTPEDVYRLGKSEFYYQLKDFLGETTTLVSKNFQNDIWEFCPSIQMYRTVTMRVAKLEGQSRPGNWVLTSNPFDRARYTVTSTPGRETFCFVDIDRRNDHNRRGGSAYCLKDPVIHYLISNSLTDVERYGCPTGSRAS